jgi:hypothetical protein
MQARELIRTLIELPGPCGQKGVVRDHVVALLRRYKFTRYGSAVGMHYFRALHRLQIRTHCGSADMKRVSQRRHTTVMDLTDDRGFFVFTPAC